MSVSTEKLLPGLIPPKDYTDGVDFFAMLDGFDPSQIDFDALEILGRRNPFYTLMYGDESSDEGLYYFEQEWRAIPEFPADMRLDMAERSFRHNIEELRKWVDRYADRYPTAYKNCRRLLIACIGEKAAVYIVRNELDNTSEAQLRQDAVEYERWERYINERIEFERIQTLYEPDFYEYELPVVSRSDKILRVRKGLKVNGGRAFSQRDFAKLIGYPANKLAAAERDDDAIEWELLERLIMICHVNPYWLLDDECDAIFGDFNGKAVEYGDEPAIIVGLDIIYRWIADGKPENTFWVDGCVMI